MFITLNIEYVSPQFYPYIIKDNIQLSDDLIQIGLLQFLTQRSYS